MSDTLSFEQRSSAVQLFRADAVKCGCTENDPGTLEKALTLLKQENDAVRREGIRLAHDPQAEIPRELQSVRMSRDDFTILQACLTCGDAQIKEAAELDVSLRFAGYALKKTVLYAFKHHTGGGYVYEPYDRIQNAVLKRLPKYSLSNPYALVKFIDPAVYEALRVPYTQEERQYVETYITQMMYAKNIEQAANRMNVLICQDIADVEDMDRTMSRVVVDTEQIGTNINSNTRQDPMMAYSLSEARSLRTYLENRGYCRNLSQQDDNRELLRVIVSVMHHDDEYLRDIVQNRVLDGLHYWIKSRIHDLTSIKFGRNDYIDLYDDIRSVIIEMLPGYSPRYMITTYLDGAVSQVILAKNNVALSRHDYELMNAIRKCVPIYRRDTGFDDPAPYHTDPFRFQDFFQKHKRPVSHDRWLDVTRIMGRNTQCISLDEALSGQDIVSGVPTPEQHLDQILAADEVNEARRTFTELERLICDMYIDMLDDSSQDSSACVSTGSRVIARAGELTKLPRREVQKAYDSMIDKIRAVRVNESRNRKYRPMRDTSDEISYDNNICFYEDDTQASDNSN